MSTHADTGRAFERDWTIAPGATLVDWAEENRLPPRTAARVCGMWPSLYAGVCDGTVPITDPIARALYIATNIPRPLWLNLERAYRADLAAGRTDTTAQP